jgi:hypothetical protein
MGRLPKTAHFLETLSAKLMNCPALKGRGKNLIQSLGFSPIHLAYRTINFFK